MKHNKLDKIIKKKLEFQKVSPKETTWNRLEMLLDEDEKKTSKRIYITYAVAASVMLLLGVFFMFNYNKQEAPSQKMVTVPEVVIPKVEKINKRSLQKQIKTEIDIKIAKEELVVENSNVPINKVSKRKLKKHMKRSIENTEITENKESHKKVLVVNTELEEELKLLKNKQLNNEVDSLLSNALVVQNAGIFQPQQESNKNLEANANALLSSVEQELDVSFKEKIFKKIKKGLINTGTAINNRNK